MNEDTNNNIELTLYNISDIDLSETDVYNTDILADKLMTAKTPKEVDNIVNIFNSAMRKKNIIRTIKYSELLDLVVNLMEDRLLYHAGEFSNKDLLDYLRTMHTMTSGLDLNAERDKIPVIAVLNNTTNINLEDGLDRESKDRVRAALSAILAQAQVNTDDL